MKALNNPAHHPPDQPRTEQQHHYRASQAHGTPPINQTQNSADFIVSARTMEILSTLAERVNLWEMGCRHTTLQV